jgi:hypothetical protein
MKKFWTEHNLTESMLKQLAAAVIRDDGSLYPGIGNGAPSSRCALTARGLAMPMERRNKAYGNPWDIIITQAGRDALATARKEGW